MQTQNGNQRGAQPPRGQQGRPDITAKPVVGEELIKKLMADRKREIVALFAKDDNPEGSYARAVGFSVNAYRKVQADSKDKIDEHSVVAAALRAIQHKLDPGVEVYFVPYKGKVTTIISPQGLINLAHRSAFVTAVNAGFVFQEEVSKGAFNHQLGSERWVKHKKGSCARPTHPREAWKELAFAWCVIDLKGGGSVVEVLDRGDIEYYRSLSPTGNSDKGMWTTFPAEAARKAAMKQALNRVPKQSEVSEILASDDTERGIEIPDDIMRAVGARVVAEMLGEQGGTAGNGRKSDPGATQPPNGNGGSSPPASEDTGAASAPQPGDPRAVYMPGKKGAPKVTVADAEDKDLAYWEGRGREDFDSGKWQGDAFEQKNITQLVTIRAEMRRRDLEVTPHAALDPKGPRVKKLTPEAKANAELRNALVRRAREVWPDGDDRDEDSLTNEELRQIIIDAGEIPPGEEPEALGAGDDGNPFASSQG